MKRAFPGILPAFHWLKLSRFYREVPRDPTGKELLDPPLGSSFWDPHRENNYWIPRSLIVSRGQLRPVRPVKHQLQEGLRGPLPWNLEPKLEPRTLRLEPGTSNLESGTSSLEPPTSNLETRASRSHFRLMIPSFLPKNASTNLSRYHFNKSLQTYSSMPRWHFPL